MSTDLLLLAAGPMVCLLPLSWYLAGMANVNGRGRPTLLSGPQDYTYLLCGVGGLLVVAGPILLNSFDSLFRGVWLGDRYERIRTAFSLAYIATLAMLFLRGYRLRKGTSAVYNVRAMELASLMDEVGVPAGYALDELPAFRSVTIRWNIPSQETRSLFEAKMKERLKSLPAAPNPLASWLMSIAVALFLVVVMWIALLFLFYYRVL